MTRQIDFRYVVVRDGADFGLLSPANNSAPSLRMQDSGEIKAAFSGDFLPRVFHLTARSVMQDAAVNWLRDQIRPELVLDGIPHPLGIYIPATVTENESETTASLHVDAYDRCWQVQDSRTEELLHLDAGTNYITAIEQQLTAAGIGLVSATTTPAALTEAREDWPIGTSRLRIVNQLLSEINYNPLWFDQTGMAILEPASTPTAANIEHTLDASDPDTLVLPGISRRTDIYRAPNVFIAVCSNPDKSGVMKAVSENTNPQSPLSIARRGRRICTVVTVQNIASQEELQAYADRMRNESMIAGEMITVQTRLLPGFGVNDVVGIQYGDVFSVTIEKAWTMELRTGGRMVHTLERVVVNLG